MEMDVSAELLTIIAVGVALAGLILNGQRGLKGDMDILRGDMNVLRSDIDVLRGTVAKLESGMADLRERMARLEGLFEGFTGRRTAELGQEERRGT